MNGKILVLVAAAICLTICILVSARSAVADILRRNGNQAAVLQLMPDDVEALIDRAGPGDLERAAAAEPAKSRALLQLGLAAESRGDMAGARRHFQEAMRRDATFFPQWTMLNFLVRRGETAEVLALAAKAAAPYEGDLTGLFDLCLRVGATPGQMERGIVPGRPKAQREFLISLLLSGNAASAGPVAWGLAEASRPGDRKLLLDACERMLEAGAGAEAAGVWERMLSAGMPDGRGRCLDWRPRAVNGITVLDASDAMVRLALNGTQPNGAVVMRRLMVATPERRYRLHAAVKGEAAGLKGAVEWRWDGVAVGTGDDGEVEVTVVREISELSMAIRRRAGERAAEGVLEITGIALTPVPLVAR